MTHQNQIPIRRRHWPQRQTGVTLLELMVGITIGLLVVAVAMGALMVSRGISGTVSDVSGIQQQAAYAMRVIGAAARQAGSVNLNINQNPNGSASIVADEATAEPVVLERASTQDLTQAIQDGSTQTPPYINLQYAGSNESSTFVSNESRNCIGDTITGVALIENVFVLKDNELRCGGSATATQAIVRNVANYQVRYLLQDNTAIGTPKMRYRKASDITNAIDWAKVQGIEVCLVLYGTEVIDLPAGSKYSDCQDADADGKLDEVDMTTLTGERARRMHLTFRNVFQLRSQGLAPI